jgi:hypothetical protein
VSTAGIGEGRTGSPVVSRNGELVGVVVDRNTRGLALSYFLAGEKARAVVE